MNFGVQTENVPSPNPQTDSSLSQNSHTDSRPSAEDDHPPIWLGGVDLEKGGTWLGVNCNGLLVAVTNRPQKVVPPEVRSRGLLCRDLLGCRSVQSALEECRRQLDRNRFDGFNLLIFSHREAVVVEAANDIIKTPLSAGVHAITNGPLNDPDDARIRRGRAEIDSLLCQESTLDDWLSETRRICAAGEEGGQPAMCVSGHKRGTVSSTVIALTVDPTRSRYLYAPGPPDITPYDDYSPQLQQLLTK